MVPRMRGMSTVHAATTLEFVAGHTLVYTWRGKNAARKPIVLMAHHDTVIEPEDHLIVFVANKRMIARVEKVFQVGVGFF